MIKYIKFSIIISIGLFFGRLTGFIREIIIANKFGISELTDNIILILTAPDLVNNIISISAISMVLIPYYDKNKNYVKYEKVLELIFIKLIKITLISYLTLILAFSFFYKYEILILLSLSSISIFPNILSGIYSAWLQYKEKFLLPSLTTFVFNFIIILSLLFYLNLIYFAISIIIGSVFRFLFVYFPSTKNLKIENRKNNFEKIKSLSYNDILIPLLVYGVILVFPVVDKLFASKLSEGELSLISFSEKIYYLPCVILLSTFSISLFPKFTILSNNKKYKELKKIFLKSSLIILIISFLLLLLIIFFGKFFIKIIYYFSDFDSNTINIIHNIVINSSGIILFYGLLSLTTSIMFSNRLFKEMALISTLSLFIKIILNTYVILENGNALDLAFNSSIVFIIMSSTLYLVAYNKLQNKILKK